MAYNFVLPSSPRAIATACLLIASVSCGGSSPAISQTSRQIIYQGICPPKGENLPEGWIVDSKAGPGMEGPVLYNSPHFDIPLSRFGIVEGGSLLSHPSSAFVSVRDCEGPTTEILFWRSPCREMEDMEDATRRGAGFNAIDVSATQSFDGLHLGYRRFWPADHSFLGICDGVSWIASDVLPRSFCRVFVPHASRKRGLYIVVPGHAIRAVPELVAAARPLLEDRWAGCVLTLSR